MKIRSAEILYASEVVRVAIENYNAAVEKTQDSCPHKDVGEASDRSTNDNNRVCLYCGYTEKTNRLIKLNNTLVYKLTTNQLDSLKTAKGSSHGW